MNRLLIIAGLALCLVGGILLSGTAAADQPNDLETVLSEMEGDGTEANPYVITNVEELQAMNASLDSHYVLDNDINASETETWDGGSGFEPIGSESSPFTGTLNGASYTISGLSIDRPNENNVGLVGYTEGNTSQILLTNVDIRGNEKAGGLFGQATGAVIQEVGVSGEIHGNEFIGGFGGLSSGGSTDIVNSYSTADVYGGDYAAGFVGRSSNLFKVDSAYAGGVVEGDDYVNGFSGQNYMGSYGNIYYDSTKNTMGDVSGATGLTTDEMTGLMAEENLDGLDFEETWVIPADKEAYPALAIEGIEEYDPLDYKKTTVIEGDETTDTELEIAAGATVTFQVDSDVDEYEWYIDGIAHESNNSLSHTFSDSGTRNVQVEMITDDGKAALASWQVTIYDILIGGQDSYAESQGGTFHVTQQFEVLESKDAEINYTLAYDDSVLRIVSGETSGTVDSGMSRTWEFQIIEPGYSGDAITISATHGNRESEKKLHLATRANGGLPGSISADFTDSVVSNTWLEWLIGSVVDLGQSTYIQVQTVLTGGLLSVVWFHHFGTISLPVGGWTLRQLQTRTKVGLSAIIGVAGVGFVLPWIALVLVLTGVGWYFWDSIAARVQEVISPI